MGILLLAGALRTRRGLIAWATCRTLDGIVRPASDSGQGDRIGRRETGGRAGSATADRMVGVSPILGYHAANRSIRLGEVENDGTWRRQSGFQGASGR